ncbi:MAG: type IV secretory system conjugative DNA transfer family protein [Bacteroidia bacterium]
MFTLITQLFEGIFKLIFELLSLVFTSFSKKQGYHADFATEGILLSRRYKGFCLTGRKSISVKDSYTNCLAIGGTGSGKTSVVLLPSLYSMRSSFVVHDPSGELYTKSAGYLKSQGYEVKVLNFSKPEMSAGYNPLARAQTSSEIQKVASLLVGNALGTNSKDPFWNTQAVSLLSILITILKMQSAEYCNLYNVRQLLNAMSIKPKHERATNPVDDLIGDYADDVLFAEYRSFIGMDTNLRILRYGKRRRHRDGETIRGALLSDLSFSKWQR